MDVKYIISNIFKTFDRKGSLLLEISGKEPLYSKLAFKETILVMPKPSIMSICNLYLRQYVGKKVTLFSMDADSFFEREVKAKSILGTKKVSLAYVHNAYNSLALYRTISNTLEILPQQSYIIVPNCNPRSAQQAYPANSKSQLKKLVKEGLLKRYPEDWCGDVWKAIVRLRSERNDCDVFVLDVDLGVAVIKKTKPQSTKVIADIPLQKLNQFVYDDLERNRAKLLNLKDSAHIYEYLRH